MKSCYKQPILIPKRVYDAMPQKMKDQFETLLKEIGTEEHTKIVSYNELLEMFPSFGYDNSTFGLIKNQILDLYELQFCSYYLAPKQENSKYEELFELKRKADKLNKLEASLANIKSVIGELK